MSSRSRERDLCQQQSAIRKQDRSRDDAENQTIYKSAHHCYIYLNSRPPVWSRGHIHRSLCRRAVPDRRKPFAEFVIGQERRSEALCTDVLYRKSLSDLHTFIHDTLIITKTWSHHNNNQLQIRRSIPIHCSRIWAINNNREQP